MSPRVFISYTHESEEHRERVLELAQKLRTDSIDAQLDRYIDGTPDEGWPRWMETQIEAAHRVLVVCTPTYLARYRGEDTDGLGARWEAALTRQLLYAAGGADKKFVPVLFPGSSKRDIPTLLAQNTYYTIMDRYLDLVADLRGEGAVVPAPLGTIEVSEEPPDEASRRFAESVRCHMTGLEAVVEELTHEQFRVIRSLAGFRRVRITGCAGSGKTLVAAEKAIRLAVAGLKTLLLCHNPLLAEHLRNLTAGAGVEVADFCAWVVRLAGRPAVSKEWSKYLEPDDETLHAAFDRLTSAPLSTEAVIVDEGQDFRDAWWTIVEAALENPEMGILYVFHDDQQALLPHRAKYPIDEPVYDLSRNCRNAGRIYGLLRFFAPNSPDPEQSLAGKGSARLDFYDPGEELVGLQRTLQRIGDSVPLSRTVLLLGGALTPAELTGAAVELATGPPWQEGVQREFGRIWHDDGRGVAFPDVGKDGVARRLRGLGGSAFPTDRDRELVREVAREFKVSNSVRRKILDNPRLRNAFGWKAYQGALRLWRRAAAPRLAAETVLHFEREDWTIGLPQPSEIVLRWNEQAVDEESLSVFGVSEFKGLEADAVILMIKGRSMSSYSQHVYVGMSRARYFLFLLVDSHMKGTLPQPWLAEKDNPFLTQ